MKPSFEKISSIGTAFTLTVRDDPSFAFNWHYHPEFELTYIVDSTGQRLVGDGIDDYGPGDLVLLGSDLPHSWRSTPEQEGRRHRAVVVQFRGDFLGEAFLKLEEGRAIAQLLERSARGLSFGGTQAGQRIAPGLMQLESQPPLRRLVTVLDALEQLAREPEARPLSSANARPTFRPGEQRRIDAICDYLGTHFAADIDHAALTKLADTSHPSLCRFFRRATGRTISEYVNELRVAAAAQLLIETDLSTIDVGLQAGFWNHANFCRQFKRIKGDTPQGLRRRFRRHSGHKS